MYKYQLKKSRFSVQNVMSVHFLHTTVWSLHNRKLQKMTKTQPPVVLLSATSVLTTHLQQ